jgi:valyl-tRNA synthetase
MSSRYKSWVENLNLDWCISRQRLYGVPFPIWYCQACGEIIPASLEQLPVDPLHINPPNPCPNCGGESFSPETDVMDTWATSSLTPQIAGGWLIDPDRYQKVAPFSLRPQAHEIIRTWTFYTILKSIFHFNALPWKNLLISGWGIAGEGMGKISKSRGGGPTSPADMIQTYSADAVRYWAAGTAPGKDSIISEEKIKNGARLVNKLWNVARFSAAFIENFIPQGEPTMLTTADKWALSKTQKLIQQVTTFYRNYDYAAARAETETLFWVFADNYLEMIKQRLYHRSSDQIGAIFTLHHVLLTIVKLFAPILPFVTERIYQELFTSEPYDETSPLRESIHTSSWPEPKQNLIDDQCEAAGELLIEIATQVRRYKSERALPLNTAINRLQLGLPQPSLCILLEKSFPDLFSITRAEKIEICQINEMSLHSVHQSPNFHVAIET